VVIPLPCEHRRSASTGSLTLAEPRHHGETPEASPSAPQPTDRLLDKGVRQQGVFHFVIGDGCLELREEFLAITHHLDVLTSGSIPVGSRGLFRLCDATITAQRLFRDDMGFWLNDVFFDTILRSGSSRHLSLALPSDPVSARRGGLPIAG
jgi:hypothetical protein